MSHAWAAGTAFRRKELSVEERACPFCGSYMHVCCHRVRHLYTLAGPVELLLRLVRCPQGQCPGQGRTYSPEAETAVAMPRWGLGWDVFCWLGHRRFSRHWSVPTLRAELQDQWKIDLSEDAIEKHLRRYQTMVAARQSDRELLGREYRDVGSVLLAIDGLQPEKGHETLYVVRELKRKRVWFAQPLLSSASAEVRELFVQARSWAAELGVEVCGWMSDKQEAFVQGVAAVFPGVPHRFCENHFLRDLAKPMLEADSSAKVKLRSKVRGLRAIERQVLEQRACSGVEASGPTAAEAAAGVGGVVETTVRPAVEPARAWAVGGEPPSAGLSARGGVATESETSEGRTGSSAPSALARAEPRAAEPAMAGAAEGEPAAAVLSVRGIAATESETSEGRAGSSAPSALARAEPRAAEPAMAGAAEGEPAAAVLSVRGIVATESEASEGRAGSSAPSALARAEPRAAEPAMAGAAKGEPAAAVLSVRGIVATESEASEGRAGNSTPSALARAKPRAAAAAMAGAAEGEPAAAGFSLRGIVATESEASEGRAGNSTPSALARAEPRAAEAATAGAAGGEPAAAGLSLRGIVATESEASEGRAGNSAPSALARAEPRAAKAATAGAAEGEPAAAGLSLRGIVATESEASERRAGSSAPSALATAGPTGVEAATVGAVKVRRTQVGPEEPFPEPGGVVLDYCAAVRGILNDDQGGPLKPPGLRMAEALGEVRASLERNLAAKKGGRRKAASTAGGLY